MVTVRLLAAIKEIKKLVKNTEQKVNETVRKTIYEDTTKSKLR